MVMTRIFTAMVLTAILCSLITGSGSGLASAAMEGAQKGITLSLSMAGAVCLWTGVGRLMGRIGITDALARLLKPLLSRLFPASRRDPELAKDLSANFCANLLGLGNAATPMGISAARRLGESDELCRLIVLNTASIQLLPTNVAAVRSALGCKTPFDILPAVWITSGLSAGLGVCAAVVLGKLWRRD